MICQYGVKNKWRGELGIDDNILQQFNLLDAKSVFQNVAFLLEVSGYPKKWIKSRVEGILELVGLTDKTNVYPLLNSID
jgi:ABC-type methionine transport system ATPase subunit